MLENMGFRVVDERTYRSRADGDRARRLAARHAAGARRRRRRSISTRCKARLEAAFLDGDARAAPRTTATTRWCWPAGCGWRDVALIRDAVALPAPDPRALFAGLHVGDAGQARRHRRPDRRAVPRALRSARRGGDGRDGKRGRARRRDRSRRSPTVDSLDEDRILRRSSTPCSRRSAPTSTRPTRTASRSR